MFLDSPNITEANLFKEQGRKSRGTKTTALSLWDTNSFMAMILFLNPLYYQQELDSVPMLYKCVNLEEKKNMCTGMISPLDFQNGSFYK